MLWPNNSDATMTGTPSVIKSVAALCLGVWKRIDGKPALSSNRAKDRVLMLLPSNGRPVEVAQTRP